jgi:chromosomal replication initiator protein
MLNNSIALISLTLSDHGGDCGRIAIQEIQEIVARAFHLNRTQLTSRRRDQHVTCARHIAMYLCRELAGRSRKGVGAGENSRMGRSTSFPRIGMAFSRDHSSVIYACNSVERRRYADAAFARLIDSLAHDVRNRPTNWGSGTA